MKAVEYLKERLVKAMEEVSVLSEKIREEERKTINMDVRVVIETKGFDERDWRRIIVSHRELTREQRERLIMWLRRI